MVPVAELAARLPDIPTVQAWSQSLAMLEAILTPDPAFRCFTYDVGIEGVGVARWCDGCGDEYWITFTLDGAFACAFAHESPLRYEPDGVVAPWPGLLDGVPPALRSLAERAVFTEDGVWPATAALWRLVGDSAWDYGRVTYPPELAIGWYDVQGSELLWGLDGRPEIFLEHAEEVEEVALNLEAVRRVFAHEELTEELVRELNPARSLADLAFDLLMIGYPGTRPSAGVT